MNMLNYFGDNYAGKISVYTHGNYRSGKVFEHHNIKFHRLPYPNMVGLVKRLWSYARFALLVLLHLQKQRPESVFYYETNSALPVYLYFKLTGFHYSDLFIHYHEYNTPEQYRAGMKLVYYSYKKERDFLWKHATWISQTNAFRRDFFQQDYPSLKSVNILPNYPPKDWTVENTAQKVSLPVKVVYVGSLGMDNFYLREFSEWVNRQAGSIIFDIYSHNSTQASIDYLKQLDSQYIHVNYDGIWYNDLPEVLKKYHVGLILYKGFNENFTFNETNKLFEYLACGLDVWFSEETKGIYKHITHNTYPKVLKLNYKNMDSYSLEELIDHSGLTYKPSEYFCEPVYEKFLSVLNEENVSSLPEDKRN